jgi:tetratricopeptide (TPR) repeat protein
LKALAIVLIVVFATAAIVCAVLIANYVYRRFKKRQLKADDVEKLTVGNWISIGGLMVSLLSLAILLMFHVSEPNENTVLPQPLISEYALLLDRYEAAIRENSEAKLTIALEEVQRLRVELGYVEKQGLALIEAPGVEDREEKRAALQASLASVVNHATIAYEANEREDWPTALKHYEAALAEQRTVAVLNNLGIVYTKVFRFLDAIALFDEAEKLCIELGLPDQYVIVTNRGVVYRHVSRFEDALSAYDEAERLREAQGLPPWFSLAKNRGAVYADLLLYDDALAAYNEAERLREKQGLPPDPSLSKNRGNVYRSLHQYENALDCYSVAERLRMTQGLPPDPDLVMNCGNVYSNLLRYEDALLAYDKAELLREEQGLPADSSLAVNRGVVYSKLLRHNDALKAFDDAERLREEQGLSPDPEITYNRAAVYYDKGDMETACRLAREARDMYPVHIPQAPVNPEILRFIKEQCGEDGK